MKKVIVEVLQDASHPEGGYGVILLRGIEDLPDGSTFRLNLSMREAARRCTIPRTKPGLLATFAPCPFAEASAAWSS